MPEKPKVTIEPDSLEGARLAEDFLKAYWSQIAGAAWRHYMKLGRGAVVLPWAAVLAFAEGPAIGFDLPCILRFVDASEIQGAIDRYEPEKAIVAVFLGSDDFDVALGLKNANQGRVLGTVYCRTFSALPFPPEAHAKLAN